MKKQITFVCQTFYPESQSTSQLFTDLLSSMDESEFEITVICGFPALTSGDSTEKIQRRERFHGIEIIRCGARLNYKKNLFLRAVGYLSYLLSASSKVLRHCRGGFVCAVTNPPFAPIWIWLLSLAGRFRYQIVCHDIYPDGLIAVGGMKANGPAASGWRAGNLKAFQRAEGIVVLGRDMSKLVHETYDVPESHIHYIPNWSVIEPGTGLSAEDTDLWQSLGLKDEFVVQYSGNMGLWHDIDTLVRAAARLTHESRIRFLFIGDGRRKQRAYELAKELGAENITWLPFQPKEMLADSLACCHVSLISQRKGLNGVAVPCKIYGILAVGRGILAMVPPECEIDLVVGEEQCGERIDPDDDKELSEAILKLSSDVSATEEMGRNARNAYLEKYRLSNAVGSFHAIWAEA